MLNWTVPEIAAVSSVAVAAVSLIVGVANSSRSAKLQQNQFKLGERLLELEEGRQRDARLNARLICKDATRTPGGPSMFIYNFKVSNTGLAPATDVALEVMEGAVRVCSETLSHVEIQWEYPPTFRASQTGPFEVRAYWRDRARPEGHWEVIGSWGWDAA
jgi:hypothetical protein